MKKKKPVKRRFNLISVVITMLVIGTLTVGLLYQRSNLMHKSDIYAQQQASLKLEEQEQKERKLALARYEAYVNSFQFIEDSAREKFGLVYPDEIVIKADKDK